MTATKNKANNDMAYTLRELWLLSHNASYLADRIEIEIEGVSPEILAEAASHVVAAADELDMATEKLVSLTGETL